MSILSTEQENSLRAFINLFIESPITKMIMADFDRLRYNKRLGGEQQCMLLTGDTGSGKTRLIKEYRQRSLEKNNRYITPVLVSRIPSKPRLDSTIIQLLKDLGHFGSTYRKGKSSDQTLTESLIRCLRNQNTELIIINEFQELVEFKSGKALNEIANRLKYISEEAEIPIVLVGMPWITKITSEPQWASRLIIQRELGYFKLSEDSEHFSRFVKGILLRSPIPPSSKLLSKVVILSLFKVSKGQLRRLKHFIDESVKIAMFENQTELTSDTFSAVFTLWHPEDTNPFKQKAEEILGQEVQSYSRYDSGADNEFDAIIPTQFTDKLTLSQLLKKK
ncbi:TniB family NTP-binding protein [Photobacterium damselae]|uniref:TniB family NTP-binding protein n=1 Tax=Photobacterium damselae TaxID=38293 RepID=UPI001EFCE82F|nr:TniB family NTP-binding protein [Photobacterium damselae]MCG9777613.1 TniB family NTP-binding protein [Photobacterium damselae]